jgi:hypothetical protein
MRDLVLLFVLGTAMMVGTLAAVAQPIRVAVPVRSDTSEGSANHQTYVQAVKERIRVWGQKVAGFDKKADTKGGTPETDLDTAWAKVNAEEHGLETATRDGWERAKASFDNASDDLENALQWARVRLD